MEKLFLEEFYTIKNIFIFIIIGFALQGPLALSALILGKFVNQ